MSVAGKMRRSPACGPIRAFACMVCRILSALILVLTIAWPVVAQDLVAGNEAYKRGDYAAALKILWPLAAKGDAEAQNNLGLMYHRGHGIIKDRAEAAAWFRMAAEQGHQRAQYNLGLSYHKGDGVPQDPAAALKWFRQAAEQGNAKAQNNLAVMYYRGEGVPQNSVEAVKWWQKAAEGGDVRARNNLQLIRRLEGSGQAGSPQPSFVAAAPVATPASGSIPSSAKASVSTGFLVQLGAFRSEQRASREAGRLNRLHQAVLSEMQIAPARADLNGRGVFYRLRTGPFQIRSAAPRFCQQLIARNQNCIVISPGR